ncbi:MAG: hypothetical protein CM1200mP13_10640 [Candidatus Pelagibacterales bacterium]|nr:MAG: hypothetical protein CM1200mP13_10640 [Pelagibacterales bacterium]
MWQVYFIENDRRLEKVDEGKIQINDKIINELHPSKRETAMVFQSYAL